MNSNRRSVRYLEPTDDASGVERVDPFRASTIDSGRASTATSGRSLALASTTTDGSSPSILRDIYLDTDDLGHEKSQPDQSGNLNSSFY